jgi:nucleoside-diphosphate-sugar epimerase
MRVLVTGASGFVGQHLIRELRARGIEVCGLSRSEAADQAVRAAGALPRRGDLLQPDSLAGALDGGYDALFHIAADTSTWRGDAARQTAVNVDGTRALARAARARGIRMIHTSSVSSFSHLVHGTLTEDTPRRGGESWINYERSKFLGEEAVRAEMALGLNATILYPAHIFGPGDTHNWSRLISLIHRGELPGAPPGSGAFADVREVARAHVAAWQRDTQGRAYLLGGEQASFLDLIGRIGTRLQRKVPRRATLALALKLYAKLQQQIAEWRGRTPEMTPEAAQFTCHHLAVDSTRAIRELGYTITPLDRLLDDTIGWMRETGMLARP